MTGNKNVVKNYCINRLILKTADVGRWVIDVYENPNKLNINEKERLQIKNDIEEMRALALELIDW